MFSKILKLLLLLSPIAYTTGIRPEKFELIFFHIGVMVLFIASLYDTPKKLNTNLVPLSILLAISILSVALHAFNTASLGVLLNVFIFFIGLNLVCGYMGEVKQYYKYIVWAAVINCAVWLIQRYVISFIPFPATPFELSGGIFGTTPRLFNYLAVVVPIAFSVSPLFLIIPVLAVIGGQFAPVVTAGITLFLSAGRRIKIGVILVMMWFCFYFNQHVIESFRVRLQNIFPQVVMGIGQVPFMGHGLGAYYQAFGNDSFNLFLLLGYDLGLLGMFALGYAIWKARRLFRINVQTVSMISVLAVSMFDYVIEIPRLWWTLMFITASFITQEEKSC